MTTTKDILLRAAEIIEQGWTQHTQALDQEKKVCHPADKRACAFCMMGAIFNATKHFGHPHEKRFAAIEQVTKVLPMKYNFDIMKYNDAKERTKEQVAATLRKAAYL